MQAAELLPSQEESHQDGIPDKTIVRLEEVEEETFEETTTEQTEEMQAEEEEETTRETMERGDSTIELENRDPIEEGGN